MTAKLLRGPSKQSTMILASRNVHIFVWLPHHGRRYVGHDSSVGGTVRWRNGNDWRHLRLVLWQRNPMNARKSQLARQGTFRVRPTVTVFELCGWRTINGTRERWGLKQYARFKIGVGGRQIA